VFHLRPTVDQTLAGHIAKLKFVRFTTRDYPEQAEKDLDRSAIFDVDDLA
jgi:hypothetical protein